MRYGFIKLRNDDGTNVYMEVNDYERYQNYDVFKDHAESLIIYDKIYIGILPLIFKENEILEYNEDAKITNEIPLTDIVFLNSKVSTVAKILFCDNV